MSGRFAVPEGNIVLYDKIFLSVLWPVHLSSIAVQAIMRHHRKKIEISGTIGFDDTPDLASFSFDFSVYMSNCSYDCLC